MRKFFFTYHPVSVLKAHMSQFSLNTVCHTPSKLYTLIFHENELLVLFMGLVILIPPRLTLRT